MDDLAKIYDFLTNGKKKKAPKFQDYIDFFDKHLPTLRRCAMTGECVILDNGTWQPAASMLPVLMSHACETGFLKRSELADHLSRYFLTKTPELIVDIPVWDGVDRIAEIAKAVTLKNGSQEDFEALLKEWGALVFQRLENPTIQNRIFVLKGGQGIGKDTLVQNIIGGLGPYTTNLAISRNEADNLAMLADHLVLNISEFDRTSRTDASMIKDWITREEATFRRPYERSHKRYDIRCSFIATVNVDEILRDHTGNRRFVVFEVERIDWNYPKNQSLQILAQFRHLADSCFKAPSVVQERMKAYIETHTPDDPKEALLEVWDERLANLEKDGLPDRDGEFSANDISFVIADLSRTFGFASKTIFSILKSSGRSRRTTHGRKIYYRKKNEGHAL